MWEGSSTDRDNVHKQVGLGWIRELPEHWILAKQKSKSGDNACPYFYLQFVASISTLSSYCHGL